MDYLNLDENSLSSLLIQNDGSQLEFILGYQLRAHFCKVCTSWGIWHQCTSSRDSLPRYTYPLNFIRRMKAQVGGLYYDLSKN